MKFRTIPVLIGLLVGLVMLALVALFDHLQQELRGETARLELSRQLGSTRARLEGAINSCLLESQGLVTYVATHPHLTSDEFNTYAKMLVNGPPPVARVGLIRGSLLRDVYPQAGNEKALGMDLQAFPNQRESLERCRISGKPMLIGPVTITSGESVLIARIPIYQVAPPASPLSTPPENYWGMVDLIIPPGELFRQAGVSSPGDPIQYGVQAGSSSDHPDQPLYLCGPSAVWQHDPVVVDVTVPGGQWRLAAAPLTPWTETPPQAWWFRVGGVLLAILIGVLVAMRTSEPQRLNEAVAAATRALRESEEKFRRLYENSPDFITVVNRDGVIQMLNRARALIPREKLIGRRVTDFYPPEESERSSAGLARVFEEGTFVELDQRARTSDGMDRWFRNRIVPILEDGRVVSAMYISTEITEIITRERALKESEDRFRRVFTESPVGMLMVGMDCKIIRANATICRLLGYTETEITGLSLQDISPSEEFAIDKLWFDNAVSGADILVNRVKRYRTKSGQILWANLTGTMMRDNQNQPLYALRMVEDITKRRAAEEALKAAEQRNRAMLDAIPDILQRVRRDGTYLDFTTGGEQSRFVDTATAVGRNVRDFFPPATAARFMQVVDQTLASGKLSQFEITLTREGQSIDYDVRVVVCAPDEVLVLVRNITQAKRAREILRNLVEATAHTTGEDFLLVLVRSMAKMLGVRFGFIAEFPPPPATPPANAAVNPASGDMANPAAAAPPNNRALLTALWAEDQFLTGREYLRDGSPCEHIRSGDVVAVPMNVAGAYPDAAWLRDFKAEGYMAVPLTNVAGQVCGIMGIMHIAQLTDEATVQAVLKLFATRASVELQRRDAVRALSESEERFRRLSEASFEGLTIHERGVLIDCNQVFANMFGLTLEEAIGSQILNFVTPESRAEITRRMLSGDEHPYEAVGVRKDGTRFHGEILPRNMPYHGRMVRVTAVRDVTERKRAEEERRLLERQVQHSQKLESLGILAGGIAHDFNNLLTGILGHASLAQLEMSPESPTRAAIQQIEIAARRAADLTNQLLAYSGKGKFVVQPVALPQLVREMAQLLEISIPKKIRLVYDFLPKVPPIDADASQIQQVVMNLITNAADAIGAANGQITVSIGVEQVTAEFQAASYLDKSIQPGHYAFLEVRDTGCGMTEETKARIFDPFFTTKFTGRGLGLAAVMGIVRSHRGALQVASEPGVGTVFRILLPVSTEVAAAPAPKPKTDRIWIGIGTVLVVDDEESVRTVARMMLQKFGYQVLTANDGREGVELFRQRQTDIHVVLLDMTMPQMSGEEAFREMVKIRPGIPVILSSGYTEQEAVSRFGVDGLAGFIQKPYRTMELIQMVQSALNR